MSRKRKSDLPSWLVVLMVLAAIVVLGPPAVALVAGLLGLAVGLAAIALKVGIVVAVVYGLYLVLHAIFGKPNRSREDELRESTQSSIDNLARVDESRRALDEELDRAVAAARK